MELDQVGQTVLEGNSLREKTKFWQGSKAFRAYVPSHFTCSDVMNHNLEYRRFTREPHVYLSSKIVTGCAMHKTDRAGLVGICLA